MKVENLFGWSLRSAAKRNALNCAARLSSGCIASTTLAASGGGEVAIVGLQQPDLHCHPSLTSRFGHTRASVRSVPSAAKKARGLEPSSPVNSRPLSFSVEAFMRLHSVRLRFVVGQQAAA